MLVGSGIGVSPVIARSAYDALKTKGRSLTNLKDPALAAAFLGSLGAGYGALVNYIRRGDIRRQETLKKIRYGSY